MPSFWDNLKITTHLGDLANFCYNASMQDKTYLYGTNSLYEALASVPKAIRKVWIVNTNRDDELKKLVRSHSIALQTATSEDIRRLVGEVVHQGIVADIDTRMMMTTLNDAPSLQNPDANTCVVILDEITDPHNMGAIIRSAAGFGASAVIFPAHNQVQVTGAVIKASAGMVFHMPLIQVTNVNATIRTLKERGFWIYGLDMAGQNPLHKEKFTTPVAFVVGNEGLGVHTKTMEHCDVKLSIPMHSTTESLNASVSAAVCLYEWYSQHPYGFSQPQS